MKNPSVNSIVERKWTPEQFWEYLEAFVGEWEADTIKDAMEGFGLTVASATIISELQAENGRLTRELQSEKDESDTYCKWWREEQEVTRNIKARLTGAESSLAELQATVKRLTANPADQRYWEGRYRDEAAALSRIKEDTIEECAKVAELTRVSANGHPQIDAPTPHDMKLAIASAIRSLGSTGGAEKTAESGNPAPTRERD